MSKRWTKQKAGQQSSKKKKSPQGTGSGGGGAGGGTMSGMRSGIQRFFGGGGSGKPKGTAEKLLDGILWVAVLVAGWYFLQNRCAR
jgi:hypothetical protein